MKLPIYIEAAMGVFLVVILAMAGRNGMIPQNQKNNVMKQSEVEQKSDSDMQNEKEAVAEEATDSIEEVAQTDSVAITALALIKLGLVPYGDIRPITAYDPTLTFNTIGRHQSMLVRTRVASTGSPWLSHCDAGSEYEIAISHGEGRFVAPQNVLDQLVANGQVATQYVDLEGEPTMDQRYNPNGSLLAIEGITSPDGRVFGKMGHSERSGEYLYKNVTGDKYQPIFEGGVDYFKV